MLPICDHVYQLTTLFIYVYMHTYVVYVIHKNQQNAQFIQYRGADKSLVRPGRKQATANFCKPLKEKFIRLSVQPRHRGSNDHRVGRKMATCQLLFQSGRARDLSAPLECINLIIVSSTCFEHPSVHPQEDLYMQSYVISFMHT